jgi:hypothetical protein
MLYGLEKGAIHVLLGSLEVLPESDFLTILGILRLPSSPEVHLIDELPAALFERIFNPAAHPPAHYSCIVNFYHDPNSNFSCVATFTDSGSLGRG